MKKYLYTFLLALSASTTLSASNCDSLDGLDEKLACYDALKRCTTIGSDSQRLACYESSKPATAEIVDIKEVKPAAESKIAESVFPVKGKSPSTIVQTQTIAATIEQIRLNRSEIVHLFLDNGQVWKELARSRFPYKAGQKVTLSKGTLGSVKLHAEGMKKYAKVSRVK